MTSRARVFVRLGVTLILACVLWVVLAYLVTAPLGEVYGWGGHPAIPSAPESVYIVLYLIVLPVICLGLSWWLTRAITR